MRLAHTAVAPSLRRFFLHGLVAVLFVFATGLIAACGQQDEGGPAEVCDNEVDDDENGLVDCDDRACFAAPNCQIRQEHCYNLVDDDGDGDVDCADSECESTVVCLERSENCINGADDDANGDRDCNDDACQNTATCLDGAENCTNGVDDDGDGSVDCEDTDCADTAVCAARGEICDSGSDEDEDGAVDCEDSDCERTSICLEDGGEVCNNAEDDDGDGLVDCRDLDCAYTSVCLALGEKCGNGIDDDGNGAADCQDPQCEGAPECQSPAENCTDGTDNDGDGDVDCDDSDCDGTSFCDAVEVCDSGADDDGDGDVDCDDADCDSDPACGSYTLALKPTPSGGVFVGKTNGRIGPVAVEVRDQNAALAARVPLSVTGTPGTTINQQEVVTNGMGLASLDVRLGAAVGDYSFTVTAPDGTSVQIDASATSPANDVVMPLANLGRDSGSPADGASALSQPLGVAEVAVDEQSGALFVADPDNHRVYRIAANGVLSTLAGTGSPGFSGDGAAADGAQLDSPVGLAFDGGTQRLFVGDTGNGVLRVVDLANGTIDTITESTGGGTAPPFSAETGASGASVGSLFSIEVDSNGVVYASGGDSSGVLRFSDESGSWRVQNEVTEQGCGSVPPGGMVLAECGTNGCPLELHDAALLVYGSFCGDSLGSASPTPTLAATSVDGLFPVLNSDGTATTLPAPALRYAPPAEVSNIVADDAGNVFLAAGTRVLRVDIAEAQIESFTGSDAPGSSNDFLARQSATFTGPLTLAMGPDGGLVVADMGSATLSKVIGANTTELSAVFMERVGYTGESFMRTGTLTSSPPQLEVVDGQGRPLEGVRIWFSQPMGLGSLENPQVLTDSAGAATVDYAAHVYNDSARVEAMVQTLLGTPIQTADFEYRVTPLTSRKISTFTNIFQKAGVPEVGASTVGAPLGAAFDVAADGYDNVFISDRLNHQVYRVDADGKISAFAGSGAQGAAVDGEATLSALDTPGAMAYDDINLKLYVIEEGTGRVLRLDYDPTATPVTATITAVAGGGSGAVSTAAVDATTVALEPYSIGHDSLTNTLFVFGSQVDGLARIDSPDTTPMISTQLATDPGCTGSSMLASCAGNKCRVDAQDEWVYIFGDYCDTSAGTSYPALMGIDTTAAQGPVIIGSPAGTGNGAGTPVVASSFEFIEPVEDIYMKGSVQVFFSQPALHTVRMYDRSDSDVTVLINSSHAAGYSGAADSAAAATMDTPLGIGVDPGVDYLWVVDSGNSVVRRVTDPVPDNIIIGF